MWTYFLVFNFLILGYSNVVLSQVFQNTNDFSSFNLNNTRNLTQADRSQRKWISQLFLESEENFDMHPNVSAECKRDFQLYKLHLRNQSTWAIRMYESSEWPSKGILSSTTFHMGNWDACLMISNYNVKGQYCKVQGVYNYTNAIQTDISTKPVEWPSEELPIWNVLKMFEANSIRANRTVLNWALCIPASCSSSELELSLRNTVSPIFENQNLSITIDVETEFCHQKKNKEYSSGYYAINILLIGFVVLILLSSTNEIMEPKDTDNKDTKATLFKEVFDSFSIITNYKLLFHSPKAEYGIVHTIKFIGIILIIYGHRRVYSLGYPNFNFEKTEIEFKNHMNYIELIHLTFVDVFFMITGFLTFHFDFSSMQKYGGNYFFISVVHRWTRLIPVFGVFILFLIYIFPYLSDGPLWDSFVTEEINRCKASWWANALAISNIFEVDNQCLIISWYMSTDMQLSIIGFVLMYALHKNKKLGIYLIVLTFLLGMVSTFIVTYVNQFHGLLPIVIRFLQGPSKTKEFTRFYISTYTRIGPYLVGFAAAVIVKILNEKNIQFTTKQKVFGTLLTLIIGEGYQHLGVSQYEFGYQYNAFQNSLHAATHRAIFVIPEAFILCVYFTSGLGFVDQIFDNSFIPVPGRLTYSAFLVNTVIQLLHASSQRMVLPASILMNRFWWVGSDVIYSYLIGAFVFLAIESPFANISKLIRTRLLRTLSKPHPKATENQEKKGIQEFNYPEKKSSVKNGNYNNGFYSESTEDTNHVNTKM